MRCLVLSWRHESCQFSHKIICFVYKTMCVQIFDSSFVYMQPLFAYNALIWKNTIIILTLILFVVFLVRGLYLFAVLGKHLLKSNQGFQYKQQARDIRNSFW